LFKVDSSSTSNPGCTGYEDRYHHGVDLSSNFQHRLGMLDGC